MADIRKARFRAGTGTLAITGLIMKFLNDARDD
jgi:hypothetical protein